MYYFFAERRRKGFLRRDRTVFLGRTAYRELITVNSFWTKARDFRCWPCSSRAADRSGCYLWWMILGYLHPSDIVWICIVSRFINVGSITILWTNKTPYSAFIYTLCKEGIKKHPRLSRGAVLFMLSSNWACTIYQDRYTWTLEVGQSSYYVYIAFRLGLPFSGRVEFPRRVYL